jgi:CheY-like chemotaxis protein
VEQFLGSILVVDDDPDIRLSLIDTLEDEGFAVTSAAHGLDALQLLRSKGSGFDLVVLDLMMPVMNGFQFRRKQREDPDLATIPVLLLSGGNYIAEAAASIEAAGFVRKPIDRRDLLTVVERTRRRDLAR